MKPELKPKFVALLRQLHEEGRQCTGALCRVNQGNVLCFCAEGALVELYRQETKKGEWVHEGGTLNIFSFTEDGIRTGGTISSEIREWAGFEEHPGLTVPRLEDWRYLFSVNDCGVSLAEIADLVESQW